MKVKKYQTSEEHTILTALITHSGVLGAVTQAVSEMVDPFPNKWSCLVAKWCFTYYTKYQKAPGKSIRQLFNQWAQKTQDESTVELVERYLTTLSDQYETAKTLNEQFLIDLSSNYFERVRLRQMTETIESALERKDLQEAREAVSGFSPVSFGGSAWRNPFSKESIKQTFRRKEQQESIVQFPGALGEFLSPYFERTGFVSFCGPDKRGKSFWLQEVAWRAIRQRRRVLWYVLGDMSEEQVNQRLYTRMTWRTWKDERVRVPVAMHPQGKNPNCQFKEEDVEKLTPKDVWDASEKLRELTSVKEHRLRLRCDGGMVLSAGDIEQDVKQMTDREEWVPDLIVIDYADLLRPEPHTRTQDVRHQINATWMTIRRIALQRSCLVVTATQTASTAYNAWLIRKKDFSEDKRKNAHVTGMIGINQTESPTDDQPCEKDLGVYRLNWVLLRGGAWSENMVVWTAGNLALANPCIISSF